METIWINEQLDPSGILYACIATTNAQLAQDCHQSFQENLSEAQKAAGWSVALRTVSTWEEVPVTALKLN